jgi:hypothetical protein
VAFLAVVMVVVVMMIAALWSLYAGSVGVTILLVLGAWVVAIGLAVLARRQAPRW